jgi:hypothetical protein
MGLSSVFYSGCGQLLTARSTRIQPVAAVIAGIAVRFL